jgi:hypothetical protein
MLNSEDWRILVLFRCSGIYPVGKECQGDSTVFVPLKELPWTLPISATSRASRTHILRALKKRAGRQGSACE